MTQSELDVCLTLKAEDNSKSSFKLSFFYGISLYLVTKLLPDFLLFVFSCQRIDVFVRQNNFLDALELALSFYDGTAMAVIGGFTLAAFHFIDTFFRIFVFSFPFSLAIGEFVLI